VFLPLIYQTASASRYPHQSAHRLHQNSLNIRYPDNQGAPAHQNHRTDRYNCSPGDTIFCGMPENLHKKVPGYATVLHRIQNGMPYPEIKIQTYLWKAHRPVRNIRPSFH